MLTLSTPPHPPPLRLSRWRRSPLVWVGLLGALLLGGSIWNRRAEAQRRPVRARQFVDHSVAVPVAPIGSSLTGNGPSIAASMGPAPGGEAGFSSSGPTNLSRPSKPVDELFDGRLIPRLLIELSEANLQALRRTPRKYVLATLREGKAIYTNVAIHLKGSAGSFRPIDDVPSYTLNFEKFADGQRFHGLKKIHLNSSIQDRSYLSELIGRELFNAAGVPAPRAGHAVISLNGAAPRLHVLLEGVNRQFLKGHFADPSGNVYDGHHPKDITDRMPTNDGDEPGDQAPLRALAAAIQEPSPARRQTRIEATLDVDRFLTFMAMEIILGHWDGYVLNRNNYRIFNDLAQHRLVFLPHGMDQLLNRQEISVFAPRTTGLVAGAILQIPELRDRYQARAAQLVTNGLPWDRIRSRLREAGGQIDAVLHDVEPDAVAEHQKQVASLERRFQRRRLNLERQLLPAPLPGNSGGADSFDWRPRLDLGDATLELEPGAAGKTALKITTANGCTASWRSPARLARGSYRLEASMRTTDVDVDRADPRAGVGLRVSRFRTLPKTSLSSSEWVPVSFDFQVSEEESTVELICELRARKGTVWFEQGSLKLRRL